MGDNLKNDEIVKIVDKYNSKIMYEQIKMLKERYNFLEISNIGKSVLGKDLTCLCWGKGKKEIMFSASIHANEWITSLLLLKFLEWISFTYEQKNEICEKYNIEEIYNTRKIYFIPMVNPDGVDIVNTNLSQDKRIIEIKNNYSSISFPTGWKANFNGVDLNLQFPANWEKAKQIKFEQGFNEPAPRDFVGIAPLTEPESLALYTFTQAHEFQRVIAYHTQGRVIYYKYLNILPPKTMKIARLMSKYSGYDLEETPYSSSFAGYKDWFIQEYNKPGFTIEAGFGESPLPITHFKQIYKDNFGIIMTAIMYE